MEGVWSYQIWRPSPLVQYEIKFF